MKSTHHIKYMPYLLPALLWSVLIFCGTAAAAETTADWRPTFDLVMMWINFLILVFLAFKFGKTPIMEFLVGRKLEISQEIETLEEKKNEITEKAKKALKKLDESDIHLGKLKQRIVEQGEKKKTMIIEEAEQQCRFMLETAHRKIKNHMIQAEAKFRAELIDAATERALEILPREITPEDDRKILKEYLDHTLLIQKKAPKPLDS